MNTTKMMPVKGLLKGLRYISHIFESEKEEEIQIGLPTDVKHVAHIGMDGPSSNTPSWMNKYTSNSETTPTPPKVESKNMPSTIPSCEDHVRRNINLHYKSSSAPLDSSTKNCSSKPRHARRSSNSSVGSEDEDSFSRSKPRRNKYSGDVASPISERTRRSKHSGDIGSPASERSRRVPQNQNIENPPKIPKSRKKKSKGSSGSGSLRSSRPKVPGSLPEISPYSDPGLDPHTVYDEGKECEEISRGIRAL